MIQIYCKTPLAILVCAIKDQRGLLQVPTEGKALPGLHLEVKPLVPINEQLLMRLEGFLGRRAWQRIDIYQEFTEVLATPYGHGATLYLASVDEPVAGEGPHWQTVPAILRSMDKTKARVAYLKAWQVLTGGLTLNTKAIETGDLKDLL